MGNTVFVTRAREAETLDMSNGATDVLLATLSLAGAALARTVAEERLLIWLASHDQTCIGRGNAGFDLNELPWTPEAFDAERAFLLRVVDAAMAQTGWERLSYHPDPERARDNLARLRRLLESLQPTDLEGADPEPPLGWPDTHARCPRHGVFLHAAGCLLCHDAAELS